MVLSGVPRKKFPVTPPGIDPGTVRLVAQRLNHYATPGPILYRIGPKLSINYVSVCVCVCASAHTPVEYKYYILLPINKYDR